ncbi:MAG: endonuclease III [Candidatus Omnitrophica bacterium]|nr:endonuclease III [Candidatus Omnitrophota bacterium]
MDRAAEILKRLKAADPRPRIALRSQNPFELLVATILSAQCTDARVNIVTETLFKKYRSVQDYAQADQKTFEQEVRSTGFYRHKARNVIGAAKKIAADFEGRVPQTMEELLTLPGVARKTANVVLFSAFGKNEGIAVDTHVARVSGRLRLTKHEDPVKIERDLMKQLPRREWGNFSLRVILHGRRTCVARSPKCPECVLASVCPSRKIFHPYLGKAAKRY